MDKNTYNKILKLIIIANLLFFGLNNIEGVYSAIRSIISVFIPAILGICIAFILNIPMMHFENLIKKFTKTQSSCRMPAIFITIFAFIVFIYVIISLIIPEISGNINEIGLKLPETVYSIQKFFEDPNNPILKVIGDLNIDIATITNNFINSIKKITLFNASSTIYSIFSITTSIFSGVFSFFLGIIFAIYILAEKEKFIQQAKNLILAIFGNEKSKKIIEFFKIVSDSFSKFIAGQGTEAIILGLLFLVSMTILSIPKAIPISAIISVFSLVPIFGTTIACIYAILSILIVSPIKALWFLILFLILQQVEGNLIYPKVVGKSVGLPGVWVLFSITVIGGYAGIIGFLIAVPTMSVIYTLTTMFIDDKLKSRQKD